MTDSQPISFGQTQPSYKNNLLFTEHYLEQRVLPEVGDPIYAEAKQALETMRAKRAEIKPENLKEAQLEKQWIHWILEDILGQHFAVQTNLSYGDGKRGEPDMLFTKTAEQARDMGKTMHTPDSLNDAIVVGDAKAWGIKFDKSTKNSRSPAQQIDTYLRYSELPWGILTDGRYWRLYERNTSKYNYYYEVDLESLLDLEDSSAFLYFYLFFRQSAFTTGWLNQVLKGSQDYAEALRDSLEEEVFKALEAIAQGFLDYKRNRFDKSPTPETLATIYNESLILLYRLLFIFYAESRGILPIENQKYARRSLREMTKDAEHMAKFPDSVGMNDSKLYARLSDLFFSIDEGDEQYDIPAYNGRLFSESEHPFLADKKVGDQYLSQAIEKLARIDVQRGRKTERVSVDYQDLEVSHLGTIYEKLLEYELDMATEPLKVSGANQVYKKATATQTPDKNVGEVYLRTGNNQRKVTGSYYTPDYIVRFIVEKTLEPLLLDITQKYATQAKDGNWLVSNPTALRDDILALNVLDPATGSGHFVVDVVAYMGQWLNNLGLELPELNGEADDLSYWMRQVASACIYAVDINPLAVELAKLSIWLKTLAQDKPLSFLDHHIRVGNSLVGTKLSEIEDLAAQKPKKTKKVDERQASLFGEEAFTRNVSSAVDEMAQIETVQVNDVKDVKRQETLYKALRKNLEPYQKLATVWTARHFGLELNEGEWEAVYTLTLAGTETPRVLEIIKQASAIANQPDMRFFHWDVAFPEVFFDKDGQALADAGFDAVIGNPPYVRQEQMQTLKPYLEETYKIYEGRADTYLYFYENGLNLLSNDAQLGYITSGTFMSTGSANSFRELFYKEVKFNFVANFGENQPFKDAEMVFPTIMIVQKDRTSTVTPIKSLFIDDIVLRDELESHFLNDEWIDTLPEAVSFSEWRFQKPELTKLYKKLRDKPDKVNLLELVGNENFHNGVKTGKSSVFEINGDTRQLLIDEDKSSEQIIKPLLSGYTPRPWYLGKQDKYLIATYQGIDIDKYPAVKRYLSKYRKEIEPKPDGWDNKKQGKWEGRSSTNHGWYEIPISNDHSTRFEQPKIIYPEIANLPRAVYSVNGEYSNNKCFIITLSNQWLLALLQSRTLWFFTSQIANPLRLRGTTPKLWQYQLYKSYMERLPIPDLSSTQESDLAEIAEAITAEASARYQLHEAMRQTISSDFGGGQDISSRIDLYKWWDFADEADLNNNLAGRSGWQAIPLGKRSEWRKFLADEKAKHQAFTDTIITHEIRMNAIVYDAFGLDTSERNLIETATKYKYGSV